LLSRIFIFNYCGGKSFRCQVGKKIAAVISIRLGDAVQGSVSRLPHAQRRLKQQPNNISIIIIHCCDVHAAKRKRVRRGDCIKNKAAENEREREKRRAQGCEKHTVVVVVPQKSSLKYFSFLLGEGERPA